MSITVRRAFDFQCGLLAAALLTCAMGSPAMAAGDAAGRYSVLRETDKDTGCMLTLRPGSKAQLAPACRDNGVVIFDPIGWGMEHGRLVLTARKGHKAYFEKDASGVWRRDEKEGKALALKPL